MIIGCDLHTRYQQIAMLDTDTGELVERRLEHERGEARAFYVGLSGAVRVGIEATGHTHWFERMLAELGHELWMGDARPYGLTQVSVKNRREPGAPGPRLESWTSPFAANVKLTMTGNSGEIRGQTGRTR